MRATPGDKKYVICNGDEGDPGAFMDRMLLESFPYRIIEGMVIAAKAVGADEGIFYIRAEYPLAVKRIREALRRLEDRGLLGDRVLSTDFRLHLSVKEGAGAFVCGEETALMASLEGRRGMPRLRPPYPAESGLWGQPTSVNNVETYALVPWIFRNGPQAFARLGTEKSKGTKVFALAGKVVRGGLIEVPMGITVRQIVEDIGGGVAGGRTFKAVQIGGPSGGCVPAELADTSVDYEALTQAGAIMGSGGMVVLDDRDCMVDMARYFLRFTQDQSCGKCTLCRIGTRRMRDILDRICCGKGQKGDLELLEHLSRTVGAGSICGLGRTAPNPVLSTLRYFRGGIRGSPGRSLPGGQVQGSDRLPCKRGLHRLHALCPEVPRRRHPHDALRPAYDRHAEVYALRHLPAGLSDASGVRGVIEQMPRITIDQREIDVPAGSTILDAAESLGIEIPTLCFARQCEPSTSCLVCLVKLLPSGRLVPACATLTADGMQVESETEEVHALRRNTLELLLSDHLGDCVAPCSFGCPAQMNIPQMLRQIAAGQLREALITVKADIALPAVLGRICPALREGLPPWESRQFDRDLRAQADRGRCRSSFRGALLAAMSARVGQAGSDCRRRPGRVGGRLLLGPGGPCLYDLRRLGHAGRDVRPRDPRGETAARRARARDRPDPAIGHRDATEYADRPRRFPGGTAGPVRRGGDRRRLDSSPTSAALGGGRFRRRDCG